MQETQKARRSSRWTCLGLLGLATLLTPVGASAQAPLGVPVAGQPVTAEQIAARVQQRNERRAAALGSYSSLRVMTLSYKGVVVDKGASETVEMTFRPPTSKQFSVLSMNGSPLLRDSVFQRALAGEQEAATRGDTALSPNNYTMRLVGQERLPEGDCYVLEVAPRNRNRFGYQGKIWVQSPDFAVVRIQARPVESPSFWVKNGEFRTDFQKVGEFWFPARMVSSSHIRLGGDATLIIQYGPYKLLNPPTPVANVAAP